MNKKQKDKKISSFDNLNQSKWMRYEEDIFAYYYPGLKKWLESGMKKPYMIQFTSGLGRNIANLMAQAKKQGEQVK